MSRYYYHQHLRREMEEQELYNERLAQVLKNGTGYDDEGFDLEGYDEEGFDREGFDKLGYNRKGFDREGFDCHGIDELGFDRRCVYFGRDDD